MKEEEENKENIFIFCVLCEVLKILRIQQLKHQNVMIFLLIFPSTDRNIYNKNILRSRAGPPGLLNIVDRNFETKN